MDEKQSEITMKMDKRNHFTFFNNVYTILYYPITHRPLFEPHESYGQGKTNYHHLINNKTEDERSKRFLWST